MDFPNVRREACDVGMPSPACTPKHFVSTTAGNTPAKVAEPQVSTLLSLGVFADGRVEELESRSFELPVSSALPGVKVVLVPVTGDSDLFVSFSHRSPSRQQATWVQDSIGVKQLTLPRSSPYFCMGTAPSTGLPVPLADSSSCTLYLTVSGFEDGDFKLAVYPYDASLDPEATHASSAAVGADAVAWACATGCDETRLGNTVCDVACNTSSCLWDNGDCGLLEQSHSEPICSTGCPHSWTTDGYCDEACFNAACDWDGGDCTSADSGCSDGCLPSWIDDEECDELCHNEACGFDGTDCDHGESDCHVEANGADYRGSISKTASGKTCQMWSHQTPHAHTHVHMNYPHGGLGGHNHCRNPGGIREAPWCYTMDPATPWELCAVPPASSDAAGCTLRASADPHHYHTLCPLDCKPLLGNDECDLRCNLTSCSYDMGDCGIGFDLVSLLADQGYEAVTPASLYLLVGGGVFMGIFIGLAILRVVLLKIRRDEEKRRGYTREEMRGVANGADDDDA
eukprot:CAMPEP_0115844272 /NCGR_PEP_ID=MMETSP0287-20121206/8746_1 /TAXON_ID=412157 /ORGANISM="Chrysochromulina rotalis, Strain UIO044" /LENGTH=512 /DNA_ID=CAMNT_0003297999 /DNA_START=72 /DNA_END=1610 /DNA_ORIENTATION=+